MLKTAIRGLAAALLVAASLPQLANAEGGPASGYISPAEQQRAAAKHAQLDRHLLLDTPNADSGEVIMSLWSEPQTFEARNWCGPGSTTAVVGQWRGNAYVDNYSDPRNGLGPDAYMAHLARTAVGDYGEIVNQATSFDDYLRVVNAETQSSFYIAEAIGGQSRYNDVNSFDIATYRHPLAPVVNANGLAGWSRDVAHFVTVKQYWISGNTTTYGDTAGFVQSGSNLTIGWHVWSLTNFYQVHIQPITPFSFDKIVW